MHDPSVELVVDAHATLGEGALWAAAERALYWIDIRSRVLFRYDEASGENLRWDLPAECGAFALTADPPGALLALRDGLATLRFADGAVERIAPPPYDPALFRFNEGACDAVGRFWVGVMFDPIDGGDPPKQTGSLHSFTFATGLRAEPDLSALHNGMAWSPKGRHFYLSHSDTGAIWRFPYDPERQRIGEREAFVQLPPEVGVPDGAAMDAEEHYWCAVHGGGRLRRYAPDGTLEREIRLPVSQPTMCAFGGEDLATLYVTTAAQFLPPGQEPHAGGLFRFRPGVAGAPKQAFVQ